jgi:hypothetical protein
MWVAKSLAFAGRVQALLVNSSLSYLPPVERWLKHKDILKQASVLTQQQEFRAPNLSLAGRLQITTTMARAVWRNDTPLASKCVNDWPWLDTCFTIQPRQVLFCDPVNFTLKCEELQREALDSEIELREAGKRCTRGGMLYRWFRMWPPFDKRICVGAVRVIDEQDNVTISTSEKAKLGFLAKHSRKTFTEKHTGPAGVRQFLETYGCKFPEDIDLPTSDDICEAFLTLARKSSAPAPDGIPYAAWTAMPRASADTLFSLLQQMLWGGEAYPSFNVSHMVFPPKRIPDLVNEIPAADVANTSLLSLRNADNTSLAFAADRKVAPCVASIAHESEADTLSRCLETCDSSFEACAACFDFGSAFPGVSQWYLALVLEICGAPWWFVTFVGILYAYNPAYSVSEEGVVFLFDITSGVLQGCPLSGTLFVIIIDPFLKWISSFSVCSRVGQGVC